MLKGDMENSYFAKVKCYSIDVVVSWRAPGVIIKEVNILEVIDIFKRMLDESDYMRSEEILRVIRLLKNASDFGAKFREVRSTEKQMIITFSFATMENMIKFRDAMNVNL